MVWERIYDFSKASVQVPALQSVGLLPKAGLPEPTVEPHLIVEGCTVRSTAIPGLQVDQTSLSVPTQHHI